MLGRSIIFKISSGRLISVKRARPDITRSAQIKKMIFALTQTTAIIRLNFCRFTKGATKFVIILLLLGTILPYILFKAVFTTTQNGGTINEYQNTWYENNFLMDVSGKLIF